jgi:hypothetical protein
MQLQAWDGGPFVFCVDKDSDGVIGKLHALQKVAMIPGVAKKNCMPMDELPLKVELLSEATGS